MSESVSVKIQGGERINDKLKDLPRALARKVLSQSLRAGARVILAQARADAPVKSGRLRANLKIKVARKRTGEDAALKVTNTPEAFYAALINKGWMKAPVFRASTGAIYSLSKAIAEKRGLTPTFIPGTHFFDKAFDYTDDIALKTTTDALAAGIEQAAG